jgi:trk system potassium uptake protein TrkH
MQVRLISQFLGVLLAILAVVMALPMLLGWLLWDEPAAAGAFARAVAITLAGAAACILVGGIRPQEETLRHREAFLGVTAAWILSGVFGALPFFFSGLFGGFVNSVFEAVSGFTTTGATILSEIESLPKSLLLWRATTHWLGGMGIVLLSVAILPLLGVGGMELFKAEVPGPTSE